MGFLRPSYGSELMFNGNIERGKLVEMTVRAKLANRNWEDKTLEEKTIEVAQEIRNELLEIPDTYSRLDDNIKTSQNIGVFTLSHIVKVYMLTFLVQ